MNKNRLIFFQSIFYCLIFLNLNGNQSQTIDTITLAILAKDKEHTLPLYLSCIEQQTWPAHKTNLYIRTNNNNDETAAVLRQWVEKIKDNYAEIYFDDTDFVEPLEKYGQHEWNAERFRILGKIRQESVNWAQSRNSHYVVIDCDNFIKPHTLETLVHTNLAIVAPLLHSKNSYSNFHAAIDSNGYYADCPAYNLLLNQTIRGLVEVPVVHCAYFIRHDVLEKVSYDDASHRYEYVIFSDTARKNNIGQYLDTRDVYGYITFAEDSLQLLTEPWLKKFCYEYNRPEFFTKIKRPRISIITSVFNGDNFIKGFLEDIVQESIFDDCELILINANSPGNEEPIIKEYLEEYPNIIYKRLSYDPGLYGVWNMAIQMASADFITNANLDDRRNHSSCEIQAKALEENPSVELVYSDILLTYTPNQTFENNTYRWIVVTPDFNPELMYQCLPGPQPMWRKSMHEKYGYFDDMFLSAGDWEMWLRAVIRGAKFMKIPNFVSGIYFDNPTSLSNNKEPHRVARREIETKRILEAYSSLWQK